MALNKVKIGRCSLYATQFDFETNPQFVGRCGAFFVVYFSVSYDKMERR